jgi:CTP synthase
LKDWRKLVRSIGSITKPVEIGIVGQYFATGDFALMDSYLSVIEAIKHASWENKVKPEITWLSAEKYEKNPDAVRELKEYDGVIVPGGFGNRGVEGKIKAIEFCRKNKVPYLGLCLGLQLAVIEFARHVCGLKNATSTEFVSAKESQKVDSVIDVMPDQQALLQEKRYGGTMRLGAYRCRVNKNTLAYRAYGRQEVSERHRHRYEVNNQYRERLEKKGLVISGINPERNLAEIIELPGHPFFLGTQFHPELKSRPLNAHPVFREFIKAAKKG